MSSSRALLWRTFAYVSSAQWQKWSATASISARIASDMSTPKPLFMVVTPPSTSRHHAVSSASPNTVFWQRFNASTIRPYATSSGTTPSLIAPTRSAMLATTMILRLTVAGSTPVVSATLRKVTMLL